MEATKETKFGTKVA